MIADLSASIAYIVGWNDECVMMFYNVLRVFHDVSQCFKNVSLCFTSGSPCITMFYMFHDVLLCLTMFCLASRATIDVAADRRRRSPQGLRQRRRDRR